MRIDPDPAQCLSHSESIVYEVTVINPCPHSSISIDPSTSQFSAEPDVKSFVTLGQSLTLNWDVQSSVASQSVCKISQQVFDVTTGAEQQYDTNSVSFFDFSVNNKGALIIDPVKMVQEQEYVFKIKACLVDFPDVTSEKLFKVKESSACLNEFSSLVLPQQTYFIGSVEQTFNLEQLIESQLSVVCGPLKYKADCDISGQVTPVNFSPPSKIISFDS